ncbi:hypothetical protein ABEF95_004042 [Exophiala dermatitidis]
MQEPNPKTTGASKPRRRDTDESRAERKRIQDRLAQRATRERTKNRIAYLEQRLSSLEAGDKQGEIASLTRIVDDLRTDNNRLRTALVKLRTTIDQTLSATEGQTGAQPTTKPCGCSELSHCVCTQTAYDPSTPTAFQERMSANPGNHHRHASDSTRSTEMAAIDGQRSSPGVGFDMQASEAVSGPMGLEELFDFNPASLLEAFEMGATTYPGWTSRAPSPFDYRFLSTDSVIKVAPDSEKWHVSNGAFISCLDSVKQRTSSTSTLDMHVPFKAAIWGWDNVGPEAQHPIWKALRQVDQRVFGTWTSKAQRIALMYVCQTLIQFRENPSKENLDRVPVFLRPRPSQENIQHPAVIDFLVWPGLRDRLVFEHKKYTATGDFSAAFVENFNFHWPFSDRDIFAYDPRQGRYEVSKIFLDYAYNFKNWTMKPGFFKKFPEMQHDIAAMADESLDFPRASWTS